MLLRPYRDSNSVFTAYLPCRTCEVLVTIDLVLWNSNYYRYPSTWHAALEDSPAEFRQVYLRYQDTPNHTVTFDIDDSGIIENGFTHSCVDPKTFSGNTFALTNANPFCIKTYSKERSNSRFKVVFGQCLGLDWVYLDDFSLGTIPRIGEEVSIARGPDWALFMTDAPSRDDSRGPLWIRHLRLPASTWVVRTYRVARERSKIRLRIEVFQECPFRNGLDEWRACDVEVCDFLVHMNHHHEHT